MDNREATADQIAFFREHGWLVVEDAVAPAEIAEVAERMDVILRKKHKLAYDWAWEKGKSKDEREFKIVQGSPSLVWPDIAHARFRIWMIEFAGALMNAPVEFWYDSFSPSRRATARQLTGIRMRATGDATCSTAGSRAGCRCTTSTHATDACTSSTAGIATAC